MKKTTLSFIKDYVKKGLAEDINGIKFEEMKKINRHSLEKLYYSTGIYGINGGLFKDLETGKLYAITKRNSTLYYFF